MMLFGQFIPGLLHRFLSRLRYPTLFVITTVLLLVDLFVPDALPFADEILLTLVSLLLGRLRKRQEKPGSAPITGR